MHSHRVALRPCRCYPRFRSRHGHSSHPLVSIAPSCCSCDITQTQNLADRAILRAPEGTISSISFVKDVMVSFFHLPVTFPCPVSPISPIVCRLSLSSRGACAPFPAFGSLINDHRHQDQPGTAGPCSMPLDVFSTLPSHLPSSWGFLDVWPTKHPSNEDHHCPLPTPSSSITRRLSKASPFCNMQLTIAAVPVCA